jgi:CSLREA domain-containing protein
MINVLKKLTLMFWLTLLAVCFIGVAQVSAASITVTTTDDEYNPAMGAGCSLREAIQAANDNTDFGGCAPDAASGAYGDDTINIPQGTYTIAAFTAPTDDDDNAIGDFDVESSIIFEGEVDTNGNPLTIIDGDNQSTIFHVFNNAASNITVEFNNLTISNGNPDDGIYIESYGNNGDITVNINNTIISGNSYGIYNATEDGGVSTVNIAHSTISNNNNDGIYNDSVGTSIGGESFSTINITESSISGNLFYGVYNYSSTDDNNPFPGKSIVNITNSIISQNGPFGPATIGSGGGVNNDIEYESIGEINIVDSEISGNYSDNSGAGIDNYIDSPNENGHAIVNIIRSSITGNTANSGAGGGIRNVSYGDTDGIYVPFGDAAIVNITDSVISGNSAGTQGGGIYNYSEDGVSSKIVITKSTISNNTADSGWGIYIDSQNPGSYSELTLSNSTISNNTDNNGIEGQGINIHSDTQNGITTSVLNINNSTISGNGHHGIISEGITGNKEINIDSATLAYHNFNNLVTLEETTVNLRNSILFIEDPANNDNCLLGTTNVTVTSQGHNLENGDTCGFNDPTDINSTSHPTTSDPLLKPLAINYPGSTATHGLTWSIDDPTNRSPAIDTGATTLLQDQRGVSRTYGGAPDRGAYEYMPGNLTITKIVVNNDNVGNADVEDFTLRIESSSGNEVGDTPVNSGEPIELPPGYYNFWEDEDSLPNYYPPSFAGIGCTDAPNAINTGLGPVLSGQDWTCYIINDDNPGAQGDEPPEEYIIITKEILGENAPNDPSAFSVQVTGIVPFSGDPGVTFQEVFQFPANGIIAVPIELNSYYTVVEIDNVNGYTTEHSELCTRDENTPTIGDNLFPAICNITNTYTPSTIPPPSTPPPTTPPAGGGPTITTPPAGGTITPPSQCLNYLHADNSYLPSRDLEFLDLSTADPSYRAYINALKSSYIIPEPFDGLDPLPEIKQLPADPTLRFVISGYLAGSTDNTSYVGPKNILKRLEWAKILMVSHCLPIFDTTNQNVDYLGNPLGVWNDLPRVYTGNLETDYPLHIAYSANYYGIWDGYWNITTQKFDTIGLQNDVTYAQAVKMLVGLRELLANTSSPTVDATSGDWWTTFYNVSSINNYTTSTFLQTVKAQLGVPREEGIYETVISQLAADIYNAADAVLVEEYIDSPEAAAL